MVKCSRKHVRYILRFSSGNVRVLILRGGNVNADIEREYQEDPGASISSVTGCYVYCFYPPGTLKNVLLLMRPVTCCLDIGKCLFSRIYIHHLEVMMSHCTFAEIGKCLSSSISYLSIQNRCVFSVYTNACFIHEFLSVIQLQRQYSPLSISERWKMM